jgi:TPR repeat protein
MMYEDGNGVAQNYSRAATFYSKGCEAGVGPACRRLGLLYMKGNGVTKDNDKARELLSQSCSMKDAVGCAFLKTGQ